MNKFSGKINVDGSIAYVAQQPWIQNETIRENTQNTQNIPSAFRQTTHFVSPVDLTDMQINSPVFNGATRGISAGADAFPDFFASSNLSCKCVRIDASAPPAFGLD